MKPIYSLTPFTLLDYPDKTACIVWFAGCNMKCLYCYNPGIVNGKGKLSYPDALKFIKSRKGLLDGVVLSGGECTMHRGIEDFIKEIRKMGMLVKIDTNGTNPFLLQRLIKSNLVDYVALDFKAPDNKFRQITGSDHFSSFARTLELLIAHLPANSFEVRSTVHSELINEETLREMIGYLDKKRYHGTYYIQNFINDAVTLGNIRNSSQKVIPPVVVQENFNISIRN